MTDTLTKEDALASLQTFKDRRDAATGADDAHFGHTYPRFVAFCERDPLVQSVLQELPQLEPLDEEGLLTELIENRTLPIPEHPADAELAGHWRLIELSQSTSNFFFHFGRAFRSSSGKDGVGHFRELVLKPFARQLTRRVGDSARLAPPEARDLQAVPLDRIPAAGEARIFLSHKHVDKEIVNRYHAALTTAGFAPWLDTEDMTAGSNLEREIYRGFERSCAAVFFVTKSFKDEKHLGAEVDYAVQMKRRAGDRFAIITLVYDEDAAVPGLLQSYVWRNVRNDLEGLNEVLRALPIELGAVRWKPGLK
jgi:hypothetical protein